MRYLHCTVVLSLVALAGAGTMAQAPAGARAEFTVFLRGTPIGVEEVAVNRTAEGTTITGTARLAPPVSLTVRRAEIRYDAAGKPLSCLVEGSVRDRILVVSASVTGTAASSEFTEGSDITRRTHQIAPDALLMPNVFFGSYEAFAARLSGMNPGGEVAVYIPAQGQITARLVSASDERIQTPGGPVSARRFRITLMNPGKPLDAEVWADQHGRLVRLTVPSQSLDVVRSDIASVSARREPVSHEGDVPVAIPANGFTLAGTLSRPSPTPGAPQRLPAVILVGGMGPTDRDETIGGIPVLGQLANALADAGFLVVRYDRRGTGQSGGRAETAAAGDYAEDVRAAVKFVRRRKDVDNRRVAVLGHGEGGIFAMLAASRDGDIKALVLAAAPGTNGAELVLEQQRNVLATMTIPEADKQARVALQRKINEAVLTGKGWEGIPPETRRQADTPWFRSLLGFDPASTMNRVKQPVLIIHGALDGELGTHHAETLATLARTRKGQRGEATKLLIVPGVNHLLVPAVTGKVDEYGELADKTVSRTVVSSIAGWLNETIPARVK